MLSNLKMPLSEALAVSLIGITTVIIILAIIACLIILVSKVIRAIEAKASVSKKKAAPAPSAVSPAAAPVAGQSQGQVDLIGVDEKEAAVIMAIVSNKSGIPLERLSFKSIKLIEDEKKGDK